MLSTALNPQIAFQFFSTAWAQPIRSISVSNGSKRRFLPPTAAILRRSVPQRLLQSPPSSAGDELSEDDVFWIGDPVESSGALSTSSFTSTAPLRFRSTSKAFGRDDNLGILAALPEIEQDRSNNSNNRCSIFCPPPCSSLRLSFGVLEPHQEPIRFLESEVCMV